MAATVATVATAAAIIDPSPHTRMSMGSSGPNRGHHHSREAVIMPKKGGWVEGVAILKATPQPPPQACGGGARDPPPLLRHAARAQMAVGMGWAGWALAHAEREGYG